MTSVDMRRFVERYGHLWERRPGTPGQREYWGSTGGNRVQIFPPSVDITSWMVIVEGGKTQGDVHELTGNDAESRSFAIGAGFVTQEGRLKSEPAILG